MRVTLHAVHLARLGGVVARVVRRAVSRRPALVEHADLVIVDELQEALRGIRDEERLAMSSSRPQ